MLSAEDPAEVVVLRVLLRVACVLNPSYSCGSFGSNYKPKNLPFSLLIIDVIRPAEAGVVDVVARAVIVTVERNAGGRQS